VAISGEWENVAAEWAHFATADNPFFYRNASAFLKLLPESPQRVVDSCCGEGRFVRLLVGAGYDVVGVDSSASLIALAEAADPHGVYCVADAASLPLEAGSVDREHGARLTLRRL
jgi:ubiquinone/menaquinone biosynthesis C-methylase UbiE